MHHAVIVKHWEACKSRENPRNLILMCFRYHKMYVISPGYNPPHTIELRKLKVEANNSVI